MSEDFRDISRMALSDAGLNKTFNLLASNLLPNVATNCDGTLDIQGKYFALQHIQITSEQIYAQIYQVNELADPGAGNEVALTVPVNNKWSINSIYFQLAKGIGSSSAMLIRVTRNLRILHLIVVPTAQAASTTREYTLQQNMSVEERGAAGTNFVELNLPYPMRVLGGDVIATETTNLDAILDFYTNFSVYYTVDNFLTLPVRLEIIDTNGSEIFFDGFIVSNDTLILPEPRYIKRGEYNVRLTSDGFNTQNFNVKLLGNMAM